MVAWRTALLVWTLLFGGYRAAEPDTAHLIPNQTYFVAITTSAYVPNGVTFHGEAFGERGLTFALNSSASPENLALPVRFTLPPETESGWGLAHILYVLNRQAEVWRYVYDSVDVLLTLSPDRDSTALFMCSVSGGRGQWCNDSRLWFFENTGGEAILMELADHGVLYVTDMHFSEDSRRLSAESCLSYLYPGYFGTCGVKAITTWDTATGSLFSISVIPGE